MVVREGVEILSSCSTNPEWTLLAMFKGQLSSWKTASLWWNIWTETHLFDLVTYNVHPATGSNSTNQCNYRTSGIPWCCCPNHHRSASMFHSWNQAFRIIGFLEHSPNINPGCCWKNMKYDWSDHTTYFQSSDVQVLWSSCHTFHLLAMFSVIRGSETAALLWTLDL